MNRQNLEELWQELSRTKGHKTFGGMTRRRIVPGSKVHMFVCVVWPQGKRGLLIEGRQETQATIPKLPTSKGITTSIRTIPSETGERLSLLIQLEHSEFHDLFSIFTASLLSQLTGVKDEKKAFSHAVNYVTRWKRMMEGSATGKLSLEAQRGLIGELVFLERVLSSTISRLDAVLAWRGPYGNHQDFMHNDIAAEVKTTITKRHSLLKIQSEKQLDDSVFRLLFLVHVRLDESDMGSSLQDQVEAARNCVSDDPIALNELDLRLIETGHRDEDKAEYSARRYVISHPRIFRVWKDFPRMTEADLPDGVGDVTYSIVADSLGDFEVSDEEFALLTGGEDV